ncbi:hypothetical protein BDF20DRAFT_890440 [Mycotypha africana]|uniref:uncharacterized protein n=1 Tax=Mycotypha africana TaxID=64632 RepID=UPI002300C557|nr:uncharacterized protein BDF20DRAFT_890440 [Mycotypha africana]KAI8970298.1 hypothetical protein BDF20DRAFT_890440 [Mycotypha africana]
MNIMSYTTLPKVLTIGGSDSSGGAGVQASVKALSALRVYATSVITAIVNHTTESIDYALPAKVVVQQIDTILNDTGADVIKVGVIPTAVSAKEVAAIMKKYSGLNSKIVLNPSTVSLKGVENEVIDVIKNVLLPMTDVFAPSVRETESLLNMSVGTIKDVKNMREAAKKLAEYGAKAVFIKGNDLPIKTDDKNKVINVLYNAITGELTEFISEYIDIKSVYGVDGAITTALSAFLARSYSLEEACENAVYFVTKAAGQSLSSIRKNAAPMNLMHTLKAPFTKPFLKAVKASLPQGLWERYIDHPFVRGIADGTLPPKKFTYYLTQDYHYLKHYARAAALACSKSNTMATLERNTQTIKDIVDEVQYLHLKYCAKWDVSEEEVLKARESVYCVAYTRFMMDKAASGDLLDAKMALAPCMIGYCELGPRIYHDPKTKREGNPYWDWICQYSSGRSQVMLSKGIAELEELAEHYVGSEERFKDVCKTFEQSTRFEIMFWEQYDNRSELDNELLVFNN